MPKTGFGHSTPLLVTIKDRPQLVTVASGMSPQPEGIQSFDPSNGKRIWWCKGAGDASSPAYGAGILYSDSGRGGQGTALDPAGEGDLSATHVRWTSAGLSEAIALDRCRMRHQGRTMGRGSAQ